MPPNKVYKSLDEIKKEYESQENILKTLKTRLLSDYFVTADNAQTAKLFKKCMKLIDHSYPLISVLPFVDIYYLGISSPNTTKDDIGDQQILHPESREFLNTQHTAIEYFKKWDSAIIPFFSDYEIIDRLNKKFQLCQLDELSIIEKTVVGDIWTDIEILLDKKRKNLNNIKTFCISIEFFSTFPSVKTIKLTGEQILEWQRAVVELWRALEFEISAMR